MGRMVTLVAAGMLLWCSAAYAQVLDQVPSESILVFHVNNLQQLNLKAAKLAHDWGLDEWDAGAKDPLAAIMEKGHVTKGVNKSGELAIAFMGNEKDEGTPYVLIPVTNYKDFLGNFEAVGDAQNGVQEVKNPGNGQNLFAIQRGNFAAMGSDKEALAKKPGGIKLQGTMQREVREKDMAMFLNMPIVRQKFLSEFQQNRQTFIDEFVKNIQGQEQTKSFAPVAKTVAVAMADMAEQFMKDSEGLVVSGNIDASGILFSGLAQFTSQSQWGKTIAEMKPSNQSLLAGLPDHKYFAFGGMSWDPQLAAQLTSQILDPIRKDLVATNDQGKQIATAIDAMKNLLSATSRVSVGYVVPEGGGIVQTVQVLTGDAKKIEQSQKQIMDLSNALMAGAPSAGIKMNLKPMGPKTVDGVTVNSYEASFEADPNNPQAAQMQGVMQLIYGGPTITTYTCAVNDRTFLVVQGGNEQFLKEAIANAKAGKDALTSSRLVSSVSKQLPQKRFFEEYVALDNIIGAGVRLAQTAGLPFKVKVPADLPPLGITAGNDGSAVRGDVYVPSQTVQSLIAAGIEAYQQAQKGGKGDL